ncbi:MAG: HD-GYP domain-containing protein [Planctomycetes bacterium]|nr:HD-GYP domain-containing protein [Planctomycetota bacterium]
MATSVTATIDPVQSWQRTALDELEQAFGQSLDLWTYCNTVGWSQQGSATDCLATDQLARHVEHAVLNGVPQSHEQSPGQYLFVIPLGNRVAATTTVGTDSPEILVRLASTSGRFFRQQEELTRLREENGFFLKQVSDDFEELTFLRSMADRLGLGDSTQTLEQLIASSLPELGKSTHSEELYYVLNSNDGSKILAKWHSNSVDSLSLTRRTIQTLIQQHWNASDQQVTIRNGFDPSPAGDAFAGIREFIIVPVGNTNVPLGWYVAINRLSEDSELQDFPEWRLNQHEFGTSEASLLSTAAAMTASHANNLSLFQERETLLVNVVRTLVYAVEAKDQYTCGHSERVALYAKRLAEQVGYGEDACELLYLTGLLHDVGKIAINDAILNKPDRLTDEEFAEIQRHPDEGWKILHELKQLNYVLPGVLHHHERIDGKGYPDGLAGKDIPLDGRVLAVADAYDAMTSDRAYRTGMPHDKAISILRNGAGTQWDSEAIEAFLAIESEIITIRENYQPRDKTNRLATPALSPKQ